jgi:hypothetical protein
MLFSNSGSGCQALHNDPCRAHCNKENAVDILVKYSRQDRKDSADTYDYFVTKLRAFSADGLISEATYKKMIGGLISLEDMKPPAPPMSKFFDPSFVQEAWK